MRVMLPGTSLQSAGALETVRSENLHLPFIRILRADNRKPPISGPIRKHMLDYRNRVPLHLRITISTVTAMSKFYDGPQTL